MKKIVLFFAGIILAISGMTAQNANRKGFFLEVQGGVALGDIVTADIIKHQNDTYETTDITYLKGGFAGSFDFGYRFRLSNPFAFEIKAGLWSNLADFIDTWNVRLMPGIRWTSKDFGGNMSSFITYNVGLGIGAQDEDCNLIIPSELGIGINFTPKFYAALVWDANIFIDPYGRSVYVASATYTDYYPKTYNTIAIRLGFRF